MPSSSQAAAITPVAHSVMGHKQDAFHRLKRSRPMIYINIPHDVCTLISQQVGRFSLDLWHTNDLSFGLVLVGSQRDSSNSSSGFLSRTPSITHHTMIYD